jgi:hypothetical protein
MIAFDVLASSVQKFTDLNHHPKFMAALPSSAIALPSTYLGPFPYLPGTMWWKKDCPRHSTYDDWQILCKFYVKLASIAKKERVIEHPILGHVLEWANVKYKETKDACFKRPCTCDDEDEEDGGTGTATGKATSSTEPVADYLMFFLPSRQ